MEEALANLLYVSDILARAFTSGYSFEVAAGFGGSRGGSHEGRSKEA